MLFKFIPLFFHSIFLRPTLFCTRRNENAVQNTICLCPHPNRVLRMFRKAESSVFLFRVVLKFTTHFRCATLKRHVKQQLFNQNLIRVLLPCFYCRPQILKRELTSFYKSTSRMIHSLQNHCIKRLQQFHWLACIRKILYIQHRLFCVLFTRGTISPTFATTFLLSDCSFISTSFDSTSAIATEKMIYCSAARNRESSSGSENLGCRFVSFP